MTSISLDSISRALPLILIVAMLVGCGQGSDAPVSSSAKSEGADSWVKDELLSQMQALREDNAAMREQLAAIQEQLGALEKQGAKSEKTGRKAQQPKAVRFDADRAQGNAAAQVAIVEFTDFQCPYCARHHRQVYPEIERRLIDTGKVRYQVMDYPLAFHGQAVGAAIAANCAGEQGAYWPMYDALFDHQSDLGRELYLAQAQTQGLDLDRYRTCLDDEAQRKAVNASVVYGQQVGVSGTPKFYVGRIEGDRITDIRGISGAQSYGVFEAAVEALLN